jgi:hypothetical protein
MDGGVQAHSMCNLIFEIKLEFEVKLQILHEKFIVYLICPDFYQNIQYD